MGQDTVSFQGRILFLSEDPDVMRRQLAGEDLPLPEALPLRDQISTDEITPSWVCYFFDNRLGDFPYIGLKCGATFPVGEGSVRRGGFIASVAGKRRGKGSSREASPYAEWCAGIRLVLAESFERIYQQNCQNLGLFTSTDLGLIERLRRGEAIPLSTFTEGLDPITAAVVERGGLFAFNKARLAGNLTVALPAHGRRPMTLAEKILARAAVTDPTTGAMGLPFVKPGDGLFVKADWRFSHEYVTPMAASFLAEALGPNVKLKDPGRILAFRDHLNYLDRVMTEERQAQGLLEVAHRLKKHQEDFCARHGIRLHGEQPDGAAEGICHALMADRYVLPGEVVVGTDSHTPHSGALGCLAFGVGTTDIANAWITGDVRVAVPPTLRVRLLGRLRPGVSAKDLVLHLLRQPFIREGGALGHVVEYQGEALADLNIDERATLTNMAAEIGGFTGLVAPDAQTVRYLWERRRLDVRLEDWMQGDPDAEYAQTLEVQCDELGPMLAAPGDPGNGVALAELAEPPRIDIAYAGSCTGGKREDLARIHEVVRWALDHGLRLPLHVQFFIQFGSEDVRRHAIQQGWISAFEEAGARLLGPGCGACINAGPGVSTHADQVTVSAVNRNFPGRSGPGQVWLASPATVAASAFAGRLCGFEALRTRSR
ncbi:MAG: 2,3-dimethylmalate dehydratase large subunit [Acidobacteria bacterium ADurb.Bin340]|nr:MAG: 2,3-dimethylmalate dehydratase large subunit [Acidobacteria bacterium ADurb.Bin340]